MLTWVLDHQYVVTGADEGAAYAGRGYNLQTGRWETVSGVDLQPSLYSKKDLRSCDIRVQTAAGAVKPGVFIICFVVGDPLHTGLVVPWFQGIQGKNHLVNWAGRQPLECGVIWRIHRGALVAGDVVSVGFSYE